MPHGKIARQNRHHAEDSLGRAPTLISAGSSWLWRNELSVDWLSVRSDVAPDSDEDRLSASAGEPLRT